MSHTAATRARVRSAYVAGATISGAAREAGCAPSTARGWRQAAAEARDDWSAARAAAWPASAAASAAPAEVLAALARIERALELDPTDAFCMPAAIVATAGDLRRLRRTLVTVGTGLALSSWAALALALAL